MNERLSKDLPPKALRELRARAHVLKPVVWLSHHGVSPGAMRELDRALTAHELIKVHAAVEDRVAREALLDSLCSELGAHPVQLIGKMLVAFRPRPEANDARPKPKRKAVALRRPRRPAAVRSGRGAKRPVRSRRTG